MIVSFSVENWMSFRDKAVFSMVGSREKQHSERVPKVNKYNAKILPISAIYGGNASGKTNFFKALNFVKYMVTKGTLPDSQIPVKPFLLNPAYPDKQTSFAIEILIDDSIYGLSFSLNRKKIIEEKLVLLNSTGEKVLYHRIEGKKRLDSDIKNIKNDEKLNFAFEGTQPNLLFLTNSVSQKIDRFRPVYDWFLYKLVMIAPDMRYGNYDRFINENDPLYEEMKAMLPLLDTGIDSLGYVETPFDSLPFSDKVKNQLLEEISDDETVRLINEISSERHLISKKNGELVSKKLVANHKNSDGKLMKFNLALESDGTLRIIDLLPAFTLLSHQKNDTVFVIDELDRNLHTLLTKQLIISYLATCSNESRSQLLFTTHDALLMDQNILRRDEMWVTERGDDGCSKIYSFSEFKDIRYDKNILNSYLLGRMGGIPKLLLSTACLKR